MPKSVTPIMHCYVRVFGVKKRCRKVTTFSLPLGDRPIGTTPDSLVDDAKRAIEDSTKSYAQASIHCDYATLEEYEYDGKIVTSKLCALFDERSTKLQLEKDTRP